MPKIKPKWRYKSLSDPKYIKEKRAFMKKNGNGWWYYQGCYRGEEPDYAKQEG